MEANAPPPGGRKGGSGRQHIMEPWLLEFADEQAMKWNGYFSIADMYDMLKERCEEEGCDLDFSVGREMRLRGWKSTSNASNRGLMPTR